MDVTEIWAAIAMESRSLADDLERLTSDQWSARTLCDAWDVKAVAAHLVLSFHVSRPRLVLTVMKNRGDVTKAIDDLTAKVSAELTPNEIIESLRAGAETRRTPPGRGPEVPLTEIVIHGHDIRRAVGLSHESAPEVIAEILGSAKDPEVRANYAARMSATTHVIVWRLSGSTVFPEWLMQP